MTMLSFCINALNGVEQICVYLKRFQDFFPIWRLWQF